MFNKVKNRIRPEYISGDINIDSATKVVFYLSNRPI